MDDISLFNTIIHKNKCATCFHRK